MGRTGRVCKGYCFRLLSQENFNKLSDFQTPELLRTGLEKLILKIKCLDYQEMKNLHVKQENNIINLDQSYNYQINYNGGDVLFMDPCKVLGRAIDPPRLQSISEAICNL